jgi:hypothetical protein
LQRNYLRRVKMESSAPVGHLAAAPVLDPRRWWVLALLYVRRVMLRFKVDEHQAKEKERWERSS